MLKIGMLRENVKAGNLILKNLSNKELNGAYGKVFLGVKDKDDFFKLSRCMQINNRTHQQTGSALNGEIRT